MAERVSGPYRGYYISAAARLVPAVDTQVPAAGAARGIYVGSVSLTQQGPDDPHRMETLLELGDQQRFGSEDEALVFVERAAHDYVDRLLGARRWPHATPTTTARQGGPRCGRASTISALLEPAGLFSPAPDFCRILLMRRPWKFGFPRTRLLTATPI